jgi:hypothetical protein
MVAGNDLAIIFTVAGVYPPRCIPISRDESLLNTVRNVSTRISIVDAADY